MINQPLTLKLSGAIADIREVVGILETKFSVTQTSRYIPNQEQDGVHVYLTIFPKYAGIEQVSAEERQC
jgi:hypothetical protein